VERHRAAEERPDCSKRKREGKYERRRGSEGEGDGKEQIGKWNGRNGEKEAMSLILL